MPRGWTSALRTHVHRCVRQFWLLAILGAAATGCAGPVTPVASVSCKQPRSLAKAPLPQEVGVYRAGPLLLVTGEDLAQLPDGQIRQGSSVDAIAVLRSNRAVTLSVDRTAPVDMTLAFADPAAGPGHAIRFPPCGGRLHRFGGGIAFRGEGCARLHVTVAGGASKPLLIPVGNSLSGCPVARARQRLDESNAPFLGLACGMPNSIACDRVGVGVNIAAATLVMVEVAGRFVTLSPPTDAPNDHLWLGYLYGAGLRNGPLDVHIPQHATRWFGTPEVQPPVTVDVFFGDGTAGTLTGQGFLHAGFG